MGVCLFFIYHIKNCHYHFTVKKLTFIVLQYYGVTLLNLCQMCLAFHCCNYSYLHLSHNIGMSTKFIQYISDVQYLLNLYWTMKWSFTEIKNLPTRGSSTVLWLQTWSKQEKRKDKKLIADSLNIKTFINIQNIHSQMSCLPHGLESLYMHPVTPKDSDNSLADSK